MELEEMKTLWDEMSMEVEKQKKLTGSLIIKMTETGYKNKLNKILIPEAVGAIGCFAIILYILMDFQKLDTWYLLVCGIVSALVLFLLPVLSIKSIFRMRSLNISTNNYKQTLSEYSKGKIQFVFVQKLSIYLGSILMLTILPLMVRLIDGVDMFKQTNLWYWYAICFPFFHYYAQWVFKYYVRTVTDAENILKELEA
jgi:hypothetical protein